MVLLIVVTLLRVGGPGDSGSMHVNDDDTDGDLRSDFWTFGGVIWLVIVMTAFVAAEAVRLLGGPRHLGHFCYYFCVLPSVCFGDFIAVLVKGHFATRSFRHWGSFFYSCFALAVGGFYCVSGVANGQTVLYKSFESLGVSTASTIVICLIVASLVAIGFCEVGEVKERVLKKNVGALSRTYSWRLTCMVGALVVMCRAFTFAGSLGHVPNESNPDTGSSILNALTLQSGIFAACFLAYILLLIHHVVVLIYQDDVNVGNLVGWSDPLTHGRSLSNSTEDVGQDLSELSKASNEDWVRAYIFHTAAMEGTLQSTSCLADVMVLHPEVGLCEGLF